MQAEYPLTPEQWTAVTAPLEPAVVVAGAGSGKTSIMAARVVYLVATGQVTPDQVLGLTFTTKAAGELGTRIRGALRAAGLERVPSDDDEVEETLEPVVATYNAYAASLLTEHGLRIGHEPDVRVMADASRYQLAGRVIERHRSPVTLLSDHPGTVVGWLLALDGSLSEHLKTTADLRDFDELAAARFVAGYATGTKGDRDKIAESFVKRGELLDLVDGYRRLKGALGLMDFSDQVALAARLVEEQPVVGELQRGAYRVVLLDEYQDTSVAQAQMLNRLFGGGHPVMAVGDPNQAIYGWRGASVSNILRFAEQFLRADGSPAETYPLPRNWRSDRRILEVANALAAPLLAQHPQVKPLTPGNAVDGAVDTIVHESYAAELGWLATEVQASQAAGTPWKEIGVLVRDNQHAADVFDALTASGVPVEIVGLKGLLRLPEVAEVLATLTLLDDLTANAELITLLHGPRWSIGPRDLALLGRRAAQLAGARTDRTPLAELDEELARAVAGADPTDVVALVDALEDLGDLPYSEQARERFGMLATELRRLRGMVGEPLLELVRRIIETCGIDLELASSVSDAARARRENLDLFVKAIAEFQSIDGSASLASLLAWLDVEGEYGDGLEVGTPTEADSVKLLTVYRAKGLEWDVVFVVGVCDQKYPYPRIRGLWPTRVDLIPTPLRGDRIDLPELVSHDNEGMKRLHADTKAHEETEERRLAYVAFTRARHRLVVSSYVWAGTLKPFGASIYQRTVREVAEGWGGSPIAWLETPQAGTPNPLRQQPLEFAWPVTEQTAEARRRLAAADLVAAEAGPTRTTDADLRDEDLADVAHWDASLEQLLEEARDQRREGVEVRLPASLAASALLRLGSDPDGFTRDLARPMPRPPSRAATFGTLFHAWVEAHFGQQPLLDPDDLPGRADLGIDDDADLDAVIEAFKEGPFADRIPHAVEASFALVLTGQVVRGRIDAVYDEPEGGFLVVDWKTNRNEDADPLQLAIYRVAWAELRGVPLEKVRAAFHYVRTGKTVEPDDLPDRQALEGLLTDGS